MPKLIIDKRQIDVAAGTKVIAAAEKLGIMIPRFCYHPALGAVGACRVCAVKFTDGPVKGIQMSCMVDAREGMVISTADAEVADFRKHVIELLMLNHPHDCPVCDEGGQCLLQDMTVSGGHGLRRYKGKKRSHTDQYLGPLLQHEMNRCIQCYRCARYYQEITGYRDMGVTGIGSRVYFGRQKDGILESPFSGNLSDICPTGVYTDKPSRFKGRKWDFEESPGLCIHCSLGCNTRVYSRYREVVRQEARFSESVNGHFICDRGRYGFYYTVSEQRPRQGRVDGKTVSADTALQTAVRRMKGMGSRAGCAASMRSSLETLTAVQNCCKNTGWKGPGFFPNERMAENIRESVSLTTADTAVSLQETGKADAVVVVGADPLSEAPMLALQLRQAQRSGARVLVLHPGPLCLPFDFIHIPVKAEDMPFYLGELIRQTLDREAAETAGEKEMSFYNAIPDPFPKIFEKHAQQLRETAIRIQQSQRPLIVCGTEVPSKESIALAADFAKLLHTVHKQAGLFYVLPGANAFAAGLLSDSAYSFEQIVSDIEEGKTESLLLVENDPFHFYPDRKRLEKALDKLKLLVVMDYLDSPAARRADILIPAMTVFESGGTFVSQEGRAQYMPRAFRGGIPVSETGQGDHPPRTFRPDIPGGDLQPSWEMLSAVSGISGSEIELPGFPEEFTMENLPEEGIRLHLKNNKEKSFSFQWPAVPAEKEKGLTLMPVDRTFGTEELSAYSSCLHELEEKPCLYMQTDDALALEFSEQDIVEIRTESGSLRIPVKLCGNMAPGIVLLPRYHGILWQIFGNGKIILQNHQIVKVNG